MLKQSWQSKVPLLAGLSWDHALPVSVEHDMPMPTEFEKCTIVGSRFLMSWWLM